MPRTSAGRESPTRERTPLVTSPRHLRLAKATTDARDRSTCQTWRASVSARPAKRAADNSRPAWNGPLRLTAVTPGPGKSVQARTLPAATGRSPAFPFSSTGPTFPTFRIAFPPIFSQPSKNGAACRVPSATATLPAPKSSPVSALSISRAVLPSTTLPPTASSRSPVMKNTSALSASALFVKQRAQFSTRAISRSLE